VAILYHVIIERITLYLLWKTQCILHHSTLLAYGATVVANRRLVSISSRRGYLLIVEADFI